MNGSPLAPWQAADAVAAEGLSARDVMPKEPRFGESASPPPLRPDPDETRASLAGVDWEAVHVALPEPIEALAEGCERLNSFGLDRRMRVVVRAMQRIDWQLGRLLRTFFELRLHRLMGFPSASRYVTERLGLPARKPRALVAIERKTWQAPALQAAYREGELSWLRALILLPVLDESGTAAWVERAKRVTVKRLVDEVEWTLDMRDAGAPSTLPPPARAKLVRPEWQMRAPGAEPDAEVAFFAPASVAAILRVAIGAFTERGDPTWLGFSRLLEHVKTEWESQPRHRDPVFARDGWRCAVPVCTTRRNLHDHHLVFRSRGGDNASDNRVSICAWHHLRGIHQGRVRAWGIAPDDITWELGVRPGHRPLLRLHGEEYIADDG
jgi:hypothetical protein